MMPQRESTPSHLKSEEIIDKNMNQGRTSTEIMQDVCDTPVNSK